MVTTVSTTSTTTITTSNFDPNYNCNNNNSDQTKTQHSRIHDTKGWLSFMGDFMNCDQILITRLEDPCPSPLRKSSSTCSISCSSPSVGSSVVVKSLEMKRDSRTKAIQLNMHLHNIRNGSGLDYNISLLSSSVKVEQDKNSTLK
jgi:hypothetical protein